METPYWHQHVGGLTIIDPGDATITYDDILKKVDSRLRYAPKFTWKVKEMPFGLNRPVWVDDADFDVKRHVRRIAVPSPGGVKELGEVAGTLMSTQLDRRRPLWEMWFIEGVAGGKLALLLKYHHCLLDGVSGASLATVLLDLDPESDECMMPLPSEEESHAGPEPSNLSLIAQNLVPDIRRPFRTLNYFGGLVAKGITAATHLRAAEENRAILQSPKTPWNGDIGPRRELAFASIAMDDVHKLKVEHGVKVNDIVLGVVAGAFRRYLDRHQINLEAPLVSAVPVSVRSEGDASMDNQISFMFVSLATDVDDPVERLLAIQKATQSAKAMQKAISAREIQSLGEVASPLILSAVTRTIYRTQLMARVPMGGTVISNVPGPPVPLYLCGGKIIGIFPCSVIIPPTGLNVTVFSYMDRVDFGFHVDPDLVPDVWDISNELTEAMRDLMEASGLGEPTEVHLPLERTERARVAR
jgi:WS/DGAT/MGAT family acyltransferase